MKRKLWLIILWATSWWQFKLVVAAVKTRNDHDISDCCPNQLERQDCSYWVETIWFRIQTCSIDVFEMKKIPKLDIATVSDFAYCWKNSTWKHLRAKSFIKFALKTFNLFKYLTIIKLVWNVVYNFYDDFWFLINEWSGPTNRQCSEYQKEKRKPKVDALQQGNWWPGNKIEW